MVTATEMREIYQARILLESDALRGICRRHAGAPDAAVALIAEMEQAGAAQDWNTFAQLDHRFHAAIVRHHGNAVIADLYDALQPRQVRLGTRTMMEAPGRLSTIESEHQQLIAAMRAADADTCVSVLLTHLREVPELVSAFGGNQPR